MNEDGNWATRLLDPADMAIRLMNTGCVPLRDVLRLAWTIPEIGHEESGFN